jgi:hypothetical protein
MNKKAVKPEAKEEITQETYPVRLAKIRAHVVNEQIRAKKLRQEATKIEQEAEILLLQIKLEGEMLNVNQVSRPQVSPETKPTEEGDN